MIDDERITDTMFRIDNLMERPGDLDASFNATNRGCMLAEHLSN
jgi:hypothetical protein